jgi:hypothetical protein
MQAKLVIYAMIATLAASCLARAQVSAQAQSGNSIPVTVDNFGRAESDLYMANMVRDGSLGKFVHRREPATIDNQTVIRLNRDTLYSAAVFDLDAGPVTITLPDAGKRFMSMQVINEDHYAPAVYYGAGSYVLDKQKVDTRYAAVAVRTLVDPADPKDVEQVHALRDASKVSQKGGPGKFETPNWDQASQKKVRDALLVLGSTTADFKHAFGTKAEVDPVRHLLGTAGAGAVTRTRTPPISALPRLKTRERPSINSTSRLCRSTASGRSVSIMPKAIIKRIRTTPMRSITSPPKKAPTVRLPFNSAAATARFRTACRRCRAGITPCASIDRARRF